MSSLTKLVLVGCFLLAAATGGIALHRSVWFLWEAAPVGDVRLAVSHNHPAADVIAEQAVGAVAPELQPYLNDVQSFALSKKADRITFIAHPKRAFSRSAQRELDRQLKHDGWQTTRLGLAIVASDVGGTNPSGAQAFWQALTHLFDSNRRPLGVVEISAGSVPWYGEALAALISTRGDEVVVATGQNLKNLRSASKTSYGYPTEANDLSVSLPGSAIAGLPPELQEEWNEILASRLQFEHTNPNLLVSAQEHETVTIRLNNKGATVAVEGRIESFINTLAKAIAAEESYRRPEQRAFRLPDGTIGLEMVPGEEAPTNLPMPNSCQEGYNVWLCRTERIASFASSRALAEASLESASWHVQIGEAHLENLPLTVKIQAIAATGDSESAIIKIKLKK